MSSPRPDASTALDDQLCFALHAATRAIVGRYRPLLDELGLTYPQYLVMLLVWEHAGPDRTGTVSLRTVCERLHLDSGTVSPMVKRMESGGLVVRSRSPHDERVVDLSCTPAGWALQPRITAVQSEVGASTGLSASQIETLREDLFTLTQRLYRPDEQVG